MEWLFIAIAAYLLNAIAATIDKVLLSNDIPHPEVYAFFISLLGGFGIVLAPWGLHLISWDLFLVVLLAGVFGVSSLWFFFKSLVLQEASRVVPIVGGIQPIIIFGLASYFIGEQLSAVQIFAVVLFILGGFLISHESGKKKTNKAWLFYALIAGLLFGGLHFTSKYLFEHLDFINGFVWPRISTMGIALLFLTRKSFRKKLRSNSKSAKPVSKGLFLLGQSAGAGFFVMINYAISLGSVTIINALQGVQYVFVFFLVSVISLFAPNILKEKINKKVLLQKFVALALIILGIILLIL